MIRPIIHAALILLALGFSRAVQACDLALILASDVSDSMTAVQKSMVRRGTADALRSPDLAHSLAGGGARIMVVDWAEGTQVVAGWRTITNADDLADLATLVESTPPSNIRPGTTNMAQLFTAAAGAFLHMPCERQVLDVMTDGKPNSSPADVRDSLFVDGVHTINIIAVTTDLAVLRTMHESARFGWGGFVMPVGSFDEFAPAMRRKLMLEVM